MCGAGWAAPNVGRHAGAGALVGHGRRRGARRFLSDDDAPVDAARGGGAECRRRVYVSGGDVLEIAKAAVESRSVEQRDLPSAPSWRVAAVIAPTGVCLAAADSGIASAGAALALRGPLRGAGRNAGGAM